MVDSSSSDAIGRHAGPPAAPAVLRSLLNRADIQWQGHRPWDPQVHDPALAGDLMRRGSLALGEGYVRGAWDCQELDGFFTRLLSQDTDTAGLGLDALARWRQTLLALRERWGNRQTRRKAFQVGRRHYDIHPRVYAAMLDSRRNYSSDYWRHANTLEEAQEHKLRLICEKLELAPGQRLLDIGCGWGGLADYAARNYGVNVSGITVSVQQAHYCREILSDLPVEIRCCDYRTLTDHPTEKFDRIVSVGMLEHVGRNNDRTYFRIASELLKDDGLFLVQSIGTATTNWNVDPWIDTYIFPNGRLPSANQLTRGFEGIFLLEDWENFGLDYDKTLMAWWRNFEASWPMLSGDITPTFYRLWKYYLLSCAGLFRSRKGQLWQMVLSKPERHCSYASKRPEEWGEKRAYASELRHSSDFGAMPDGLIGRSKSSGDWS
ncbi:MAG: cyclopropane fatty acyl phospholipid synthase [Cyanobacteriota bacterium]